MIKRLLNPSKFRIDARAHLQQLLKKRRVLFRSRIATRARFALFFPNTFVN